MNKAPDSNRSILRKMGSNFSKKLLHVVASSKKQFLGQETATIQKPINHKHVKLYSYPIRKSGNRRVT